MSTNTCLALAMQEATACQRARALALHRLHLIAISLPKASQQHMYTLLDTVPMIMKQQYLRTESGPHIAWTAANGKALIIAIGTSIMVNTCGCRLLRKNRSATGRQHRLCDGMVVGERHVLCTPRYRVRTQARTDCTADTTLGQ